MDANQLQQDLTLFFHELGHSLTASALGYTSTISQHPEEGWQSVVDWKEDTPFEHVLWVTAGGLLFGENVGIDCTHDREFLSSVPHHTIETILERVEQPVLQWIDNQSREGMLEATKLIKAGRSVHLKANLISIPEVH